MNRLTCPSTSLAGWSRFDGVAIARGESPRPWSRPCRNARAWPMKASGARAKRAVDVVRAVLGLIVFAPVLLAIALFIRLDSPGPALFRQMRPGHRGRPFRMLEFRTMVADAERRLGSLEACSESAGGVLFKPRQDPRATPLGRSLRRSSPDALPQLVAAENPVRQAAVDPSRLPLSATGQDLLHDPAKGFLLEFLTTGVMRSYEWLLFPAARVGPAH
jgi:Bacterial sugar transferase